MGKNVHLPEGSKKTRNKSSFFGRYRQQMSKVRQQIKSFSWKYHQPIVGTEDLGGFSPAMLSHFFCLYKHHPKLRCFTVLIFSCCLIYPLVNSYSPTEFPPFQVEIHLQSGSIVHCNVSLPECILIETKKSPGCHMMRVQSSAQGLVVIIWKDLRYLNQCS